MSELNKIVTNFPMSLSQDENRNLALTLSAVLEGGGGGGVADAIWKPAVDQDGLLTWSWDIHPDSATPPASVNIKGPSGESGAPGRDGIDGINGTNGKDGVDGKTPQIQINSSNAHWEWRYSGASDWTDLGVVASGAVGPQGIPGVSGASGATGAKGEDGVSPSVTTSEIPSSVEHPQGGTSVTITDKTGQHQFDVWNGINGKGASVNLLDGSGIHIEQNGINYTIGVSADYALKSELPDVTDMATKTWVGEQGYLTAVPDTYATKEYANNASANALSQASAWVESQDFLTQADLAGYATETWVDDNYLPLTGGTVSGQLEVHGGSTFDTQFIKLTREGNNCGARIGLGSDTNNGTLALKTFNAQGQNTVQVNVKYNTNNNELIQVQKAGSEIGFLIPAQIHQGSYSPTSADGTLHIVLES